mmetsp:Transcript_21957/g.28760  ORF Transcript_21957/g.28760 Transcript_21957/m.28760 type:complete len:87 (+) Transcript_21957:482-742(+)
MIVAIYGNYPIRRMKSIGGNLSIFILFPMFVHLTIQKHVFAHSFQQIPMTIPSFLQNGGNKATRPHLDGHFEKPNSLLLDYILQNG